MNLLIDTDVVLDLLLKRQPFFADAFTLWQAADQRRFKRYVAAITPINVFYIDCAQGQWRCRSTSSD